MSANPTMHADPARATPGYVDGCFAWLHAQPHPATPPVLGIVLCGATAQEEVCTRHGVMLLADALAAAGIPTLRFDYGGTGDSIGDAPFVDTMTDDIVRMVAALRTRTGVGSVVLCGLRLGATLAMRAIDKVAGLAGVALLAPVVSGAQFVRDLRVSAKFSPVASLDPVPDARSDAPLNTNGFLWSRALRDSVRALDLSTMPVPRVPVLIAAERAGRGGALASAWRDAGVAVTEHGFDDYRAYMRDPTTHVMPEATFAAVVAWIAALVPGRAAAAAVDPVAIAPTLALPDAIETPSWMGPTGATFGILCAPREGRCEPVAALLLHEGSSHHIGNGRALVMLARRLAAHGIASLRIDLTGMGDSPAPPGARRPFSDPARLAEVAAATRMLARHAPGGVVASGLCSGAEMAWHAALEDARIAGTLLVNMPAFGWDPTAETGGDPTPTRRTLRSYMRAIRAGGVRRILRGEVDMAKVVVALGRGSAGEMGRRLRTLAGRGADPARAMVRRQLGALAARRVHSLFIFSDDDPGLPEIRGSIGDPAPFAPASIHVFDHADHHFNGTHIRRRYHDLVEAALDAVIAEHHGGSAAATDPGPRSNA